MMACARLQTQLDAYVDGELDAGHQLELEQHVAHCEDCRREAAFLRTLKEGVRTHAQPVRAPAALRNRVQRTLDAEAGPSRVDQMWMGGMVAAAAAMLLVFAVGPERFERAAPTAAGSTSNVPPVAVTPVALLPEVIEQHTDSLPIEVGTEQPERLPEWFRGKLGFRVAPVEFGKPDVRFIGARMSHVGDQRAAKLDYRVGDSRVTMVVFEASPRVRRALARELRGGQRTVAGSQQVTYRRVRGYTVPVVERDGVVYALTGDLDERRLLDLMSSARLR